MSKFLDLLATETTLDIVLRLQPLGNPQVVVNINGTILHYGHLEMPVTLQHSVPLLDPLTVSISLYDKVYGNNETAVIVEQFDIDNFAVVPAWTQTATYHNDHDYNDPTNYLGFNGTWELSTNCPFYQWKHHITGQGWLLTPC
jgi:hypothetical protein